jgi:hypothetical protein
MCVAPSAAGEPERFINLEARGNTEGKPPCLPRPTQPLGLRFCSWHFHITSFWKKWIQTAGGGGNGRKSVEIPEVRRKHRSQKLAAKSPLGCVKKIALSAETRNQHDTFLRKNQKPSRGGGLGGIDATQTPPRRAPGPKSDFDQPRIHGARSDCLIPSKYQHSGSDPAISYATIYIK